jgi:nitrogen fixation-related uncharacterized protein
MKLYWTMKNGQQIDIDEMSENHLRNTLKMLVRNTQAKPQVAKTRIGNIEANFFEAQNNEYIEDEFVNKFYGA